MYSRTCNNPYFSVDIQKYGLLQVMGFQRPIQKQQHFNNTQHQRKKNIIKF